MVEEKRDAMFSLEALKGGNRSEFARLVEANYQLIYRLAIKILGNQQDAEDALQETFIKAFRYLKDFDGRSSISTWLYRIATNEALMILRKHKVDMVSVDEPLAEGEEEQEPLQIVDWCCMPEEELMSSEAKQTLDRAIERLPVSLRLVFVLRDIQGLSTRETGEELDLSDTAVKTRLSRARLRLREDLSGYFGDRMIALQGKV
ncbi:MAG: sigma-70 family RNA polymerase sigma factor [Anaerolineales bacterium]|nr:sigma-70 family RNA polymerase sigma factor [Anaerolineales bacterium]